MNSWSSTVPLVQLFARVRPALAVLPLAFLFAIGLNANPSLDGNSGNGDSHATWHSVSTTLTAPPPASVSAYAGSANRSCSGIDWNHTSRATDECNNQGADSDAIDEGQVSECLNVFNFGLTVPPGATILGIEVEVTRRQENGFLDIVDYQVQLLDNGSEVGDNKADAGTVWPKFSYGSASYGGNADDWNAGFTPSNLSTLGVRLRAQGLNNPNYNLSSRNAYVDCVHVTVYYEETVGGCGSCNGPVTTVDATSDPSACLEDVEIVRHMDDPNCCNTASNVNCEVIKVLLHEDAHYVMFSFMGGLGQGMLFDKDCNLIATGAQELAMVERTNGAEICVTFCKEGSDDLTLDICTAPPCVEAEVDQIDDMSVCPEAEVGPIGITSTPPANPATAEFHWEVMGDDIGMANGMATGYPVEIPAFTATDVCGSSAVVTVYYMDGDCHSSMSFTITVEDHEAPALTCPDDIEVNSCADKDDTNITGVATVSDNCDLDIEEDLVYDDEKYDCGIARVWSAEDDCGNSSTCLQYITFNDEEPPSIICDPNPVVTCDMLDMIPENVTAMDNCDDDPVITYTDQIINKICWNRYTIKRTWKAVDHCGNQSLFEQWITVQDQVAPVITCPDDITVQCDESTEPDNTGEPTVDDNCIYEVSHEDEVIDGACEHSWTIIRTWTVTDDCNPDDSCEQTITVEDTTPPEISCPDDVTIECSDSQDPEVNENLGFASAEDNCDSDPEIDFSDARVDGNCEDNYTIVRTWTATDDCGNPSSCDQTITVVDTTEPEITCPDDYDVDADDLCQADLSPDAAGYATGTDNCDTDVDISHSDEYDTPDCEGEIYIIRTWVATDNCGNSSACVQNVHKDDETAPDITCPDDTEVYTDEACGYDADPELTGYATAEDNCSSVSIDYNDDVQPGDCIGKRIITRTWTAVDACENESECDQTITVLDETAPEIDCPEDYEVDADENCSADLTPDAAGYATGTDNCDPDPAISFEDEVVDGDCPGEIYITRTWTATDDCGNSTSCEQSVHMDDETPPVFQCCIPNPTINCDDEQDPYVNEDLGVPHAYDYCSEATVTYTDAITPGDCPGNYLITRTWRAEDECENVSQLKQYITVIDDEAPELTCPASYMGNMYISCEMDTSPDALGEAEADDNCDPEPSVDFKDLIVEGNCDHNYTIVRTWTTIDWCENEATCVQVIQVKDKKAPVLKCPTDVTVYSEEDCANDAYDFEEVGYATATDNCDDDVDVEMDELVEEICAGSMTITRTWTAEDDCGNIDECEQVVTVLDITPPDITCPPNMDVEADPEDCFDVDLSPDAMGWAEAEDECSDVDIEYTDETESDACDKYVYRTWTATDDCGNSNSCVQEIEVEDLTAPVISCPDDVEIDKDENCSFDDSPDALGYATAEDNCSSEPTIDYEDEPIEADCDGDTYFIRWWSATDECENVSYCDQRIEVEDHTAPEIECPADYTIELDAYCNPTVDLEDLATLGEATATDNCDDDPEIGYDDKECCPNEMCIGETKIERTWTAVDDCDNETECLQIIHIKDVTPPEIECPEDYEVDANENCDWPNGIDPTETGIPTAMDNCTGMIMYPANFTYEDEEGEADCAGEVYLTRTWTAYDDCGNSSTCEQEVHLGDDTPPVIECPDVYTVYTDENCEYDTDPEITGYPTGSDFCSEVTYEFEDVTEDGECVGAHVITRTWVGIDDCENESDPCEQTIYVEDNLAPVYTCPEDETVGTLKGVCYTVYEYEVSATDNCTAEGDILIELEEGPESGTQLELGEYYIEYHFYDDCENESMCSWTVTVVDDDGPVMACEPELLILYTDGNGECCVEATYEDPEAIDNCLGPVVNEVVDGLPSGSCFPVGVNVVTWKSTDEYGNESFCNVTIKVIDNDPPTIECPTSPDPLGLNANCLAKLPSYEDDAITTDNCGDVDVEQIPVENTTLTTGTYTVTLIATDASGNTAECEFEVEVTDEVDPLLACPDDIIVNNDVDKCGANVFWQAPAVNENCGSYTLEHWDGPMPSDYLAVGGPYTVTYKVTDDAGNTTFCDFDIFVNDMQMPNMVCQDITVELDADGNASITAADVDGGSGDNCELAGLEIDIDAFTCDNVGDNNVTLTGTDIYDNSASCVATVTVVDVTAPEILACGDDVVLDGCGLQLPDLTGGVEAEDACGVESITQNPIAGTNFGTQDGQELVVTLTVTDVNGNASTCEVTVSIEDTTPPVASCQEQLDAIIGTDGLFQVTAAMADQESWDDCGPVEILISRGAGYDISQYVDCEDALTGFVTMTLLVTDQAGNATECELTVDVYDLDAPTMVCQDITVYLDENGEVSITAEDVDGGSYDNCDLELAIDNDFFTCDNVGDNNVTLYGADPSGNEANCVATVTVVDNLPPDIITCADDVVLEGCGLQIPDLTGDVEAEDNCGVESITQNPVAGTDFGDMNEQEIVVTITVTDVNGNVSTCEVNVSVDDTTPPVAQCQDQLDAILDADGLFQVTAAMADNESWDDCGPVEILIGRGDGYDVSQYVDCDDAGLTVTMTLLVTDEAGNASTCEVSVDVYDNTAPTMQCQDITVYLDMNGEASITDDDVDGGSYDNCDVELSIDNGDFNCDNVGDNNVTLTGVDPSGNEAQCVATVTVVDDTAPTFTCPADQIVDGCDDLVPDLVSQVSNVWDNCGIAYIEQNPVAGTDFGQENGDFVVVTITVEDVNGNEATCEVTVTIQDTEDPYFQNCPDDFTVNNDVDLCGANVWWAQPVAFDNCVELDVELTDGPAPGDYLEVGPVYAVSYTATDAAGNTILCEFNVNVVDVQEPTMVCQDITVYLDENGDVSITAGAVNGGSYDNCYNVDLSIDEDAFTCENVGDNNVTLLGYDASGNASFCVATVTVVDNMAPTFTCPADQVVDGCDDLVPDLVSQVVDAEDNCGVASITQDPVAGVDFGQENGDFVVVTVSVEDVNGNVATCEVTVTIEDTEAPYFQNCPDDFTVNNDVDQCGANVWWAQPVAFDNCVELDVELTDGPAPGDYLEVGTTYTVEYTATDAAGNTITCSFDIDVYDVQDPTMVCQDITVYLDENGDAQINADMVDGGSYDNCSLKLDVSKNYFDCEDVGDNNVILSGIDASFNSAHCVATVTVEDNLAPTFTCPDDMTVDGCDDLVPDLVSLINDEEDNCGVAWIGQNPVAGLDFGSQNGDFVVVTIMVIDVNGNIGSCDVTITIDDTEEPYFQNCPGNFIVNNDVDKCGANVWWAQPVAFDNCVELEVELFDGPTPGSYIEVGTVETIGYRATDDAGNTTECTFTIQVEDMQNPDIECPFSFVTFGTDDGVCSYAVEGGILDATAWDNCSGLTLSNDLNDESSLNGEVLPEGETEITWTVVDAAGNEASCSMTVLIVDDEDPEVDYCPADVTIENDPGVCGAVYEYAVIFSDNCDDNLDLTLVNGLESGSTFPVGTTEVLWQAEDDADNYAECQFFVTVIDTEDPVIVCPDDIEIVMTVTPNGEVAFIEEGNATIESQGPCGVTLSYEAPEGTDNCDWVLTTLQSGLGAGPNYFQYGGTYTESYLVTDGAGNQAACAFTITIEDAQNPTITCPNNIVVENDPTICGAAVEYTYPLGVDNCPDWFIVQIEGPNSGQVFGLGNTQVTYQITDNAGNFVECSFQVRVVDAEAPVFYECAQDEDVLTSSNGTGDCSGEVPRLTDDVVVGDNCATEDLPAVALFYDEGYVDTQANCDGEAYNVRQHLINRGFQVILIDRLEDFDQWSDALAQANILVLPTMEGNDDFLADMPASVEDLLVTFVAENGGKLLTFGGGSGPNNAATTLNHLYGFGLVEDCCYNGNISYLNLGNALYTAFQNGPTSINHHFATQTVANVPFTGKKIYQMSTNGGTTVAWMPKGAGGEIIYFGWTFRLGGPLCTNADTEFTEVLDRALLELAGQGIIITQSPEAYSTFDGQHGDEMEVTISAIDYAGNESSCEVTLTLIDDEDPTIMCDNVATELENTPGICGYHVTDFSLDPTFNDNCHATMKHDYLSAPHLWTLNGALLPVGETTVTWTVTDDAGNSKFCVVTYTVEDTEAPVAMCIEEMDAVLNGDGYAQITPSMLDINSMDNCGLDTKLVSLDGENWEDEVDVDCSMAGTTVTAYLQVTDVAGNASVCEVEVSVYDYETPQIE
ncbi:MAG: HYR domain-containing protein, partial [Lewinellaceae bacterium]|nr:HYR domain-containing protein [Lewinellaceae bacterium]